MWLECETPRCIQRGCIADPHLTLLSSTRDQAHYILDEMCMNGCIVETNRSNVLAPVHLLEKATT